MKDSKEIAYKELQCNLTDAMLTAGRICAIYNLPTDSFDKAIHHIKDFFIEVNKVIGKSGTSPVDKEYAKSKIFPN